MAIYLAIDGSGLEDGTLKPAIARIFSLEDIAEAHRFFGEGKDRQSRGHSLTASPMQEFM